MGKHFHDSARYMPDLGEVLWHVKTLRGQTDIALVVDFNSTKACGRNLKDPSVGNLRHRTCRDPPSIHASFEIDNFMVSGMSFQELKIIEKSGYNATRNVRYRTESQD